MATKKVEAEPEEPRPTVREAMRSVLASAKLVAGADGLDRQVEWVRLMETPEVQPRAGDLMFTSGFPIKDDLDAQIRLVARIAEGGGAGLVVRPLPYLRKLPPEMVTEADRLKVPLFTISSDVQFVDLMSPLLERITTAEHWRLKRSLETHGRFTELVLDGRGVNEICRTLSELLDSAVSVEDASFHLLAHAGGARSDPHRRETIARHGTPPRVLYDPQIQSMLREVTEHRHPMKVPAYPHLGMHRGRIIAPILAANQLMVVDVDDFRGFLRARQITEDGIQAVKREFLRRVSGVIRAGHPRALVDARSDSVVTLLPLGAEVPSDHSERLTGLGHQIRETV